MKVKICGVTSITDALMSADAGADLIGLNFYPKSPRCLSRPAAAGISNALKSLRTAPVLVGVFVNETADEIRSVLAECGLDLAQLSGDEPQTTVDALGSSAFRAIRSLAEADRARRAGDRPTLLFDANIAGQYGGTSKTADWDAAAQLAAEFRLILAGGLTPDNVAAAVDRVHPWAVDVASGVESSPGIKDPARVTRFIERAKYS